MFYKDDRGWKIVMFLSLLFITIACSSSALTELVPGSNEPQDYPPSVSSMTLEAYYDESPSDTSDQWDIHQCNAFQDISIIIEDLEEYDDGDGHVECSYNQKITNNGSQPIRFIYYKHYDYGNNEVPNNYEFGWQVVSPRQPGGTWMLKNFLSDCAKCTPTRYESLHISIAAVYDTPECQWVAEVGSPHFDILQITEEEPLLSPCTVIYPDAYGSGMPDISEGLHR